MRFLNKKRLLVASFFTIADFLYNKKFDMSAEVGIVHLTLA